MGEYSLWERLRAWLAYLLLPEIKDWNRISQIRAEQNDELREAGIAFRGQVAILVMKLTPEVQELMNYGFNEIVEFQKARNAFNAALQGESDG